jgi:hypothetical protein
MAEITANDLAKIQSFVQNIFSGRRYETVKIRKVEFVYFPSAYNISVEGNGKSIAIKIPSELIEEAVKSGDAFKRSNIKNRIKEALGFGHQDD